MAENKGQFKKGEGGRKKGSKNKVTQKVKSFYENLLAENEEQIREDLQKLKPKERLDFLQKISSFVYPSKKQVTEIIDPSNMSDEQVDELVDKIINKIES